MVEAIATVEYENEFQSGETLVIAYIIFSAPIHVINTLHNGMILYVAILLIFGLVLPGFIMIVCANIQSYKLLKIDIITVTEQRGMTITICLITLLCIICNTAYVVFTVMLLFKMNSCINYHTYKNIFFGIYILSTILPFLNAAFSPVILIVRGKALRVFTAKKVKTLSSFMQPTITTFGQQNNENEPLLPFA